MKWEMSLERQTGTERVFEEMAENFPNLRKNTNLPVTHMVKSLPAMQETRVQSFDWEYPLEKEMATHSSILTGEFHGQRSLVGYRPRGHKESDTTE